MLGDWDHPYLTLDPAYEADIIRSFGRVVEEGRVYRKKKPVLWSTGAQTALAVAEVVLEAQGGTQAVTQDLDVRAVRARRVLRLLTAIQVGRCGGSVYVWIRCRGMEV